jgi:phage-related protein
MALTTAISDFVKSIFELFASFFQTLFALIQTILMTVYNFVASVLQLGADSFKGVFDIFGGVANFLLCEYSSEKATYDLMLIR